MNFNGAPRKIRTPDLLIRSQTLYPAELAAQNGIRFIAYKRVFVNLFPNKNGGEGGIRTPGSLRYTRLAGGHHRPLGHLSATCLFIIFIGGGGRIWSLRHRHPGDSCVTSPAFTDASIRAALLTFSQRFTALQTLRTICFKLAEEVGFEPTELSFNSFQDCRLKPLGHSSGST